MTITTLAFWQAAAERAVKTAAQVAASLLVLDQLAGVLDIDWGQVAQVSALAGVVSVLTSLASAGTGNGPSLTNSETLTEPAKE